MSESAYILREYLDEKLRKATEEAAKRVIPADEKQSYEIGKALGYTDGLKAARALLWELPEAPNPQHRRVWGRDKPL